MSTRVPAPLHAYSRRFGFRPIGTEQQESTSKSGSGLMDGPDHLPHPKSAAQSSPAGSTDVENPGNTSASANKSQYVESPNQISIRILTWNIWFNALLRQQRTNALISTIKSLSPLPDVCCFQECTGGVMLQLQEDDWWRKTWAMTNCNDQFDVTGSNYGTTVFVRRELVGEMEFKAEAWFEPFETTQTGRGLLVLELTPPRSKRPLLVATTHMDYTAQIRATQLAAAIATLSATPTSIFCGDTNIDTYPELEPLLSAGYVDSWLETHPDFANSPDPRAVGITFGTFGLRGPAMPSMASGLPRRLDYVMTRGVNVARCELVGNGLIPKDEWATNDQEKKLDFSEVYVSDHLGVLVDAELV